MKVCDYDGSNGVVDGKKVWARKALSTVSMTTPNHQQHRSYLFSRSFPAARTEEHQLALATASVEDRDEAYGAGFSDIGTNDVNINAPPFSLSSSLCVSSSSALSFSRSQPTASARAMTQLEHVFRVSMCCLSCVGCCAEEKRYLLQKESRLRIVDVVLKVAKSKKEVFGEVLCGRAYDGQQHSIAKEVLMSSSTTNLSYLQLSPAARLLIYIFSMVEDCVGTSEGRQAIRLLKERLEITSNSPDAMIDEFTQCENVLINSDKPLMLYEEESAQVALPVEKKTEFGLFLRHHTSEFEFLQFEEVCELMTSLKYTLGGCSGNKKSVNSSVPPSLQYQAQRDLPFNYNEMQKLYESDSDSDNEMDVDISQSDEEDSRGRKDMELYPNKEKGDTPKSLITLKSSSRGVRTPYSDNTNLGHGVFTLPESDYDKYLNAMSALDHPAAIEFLHRHFDYVQKTGPGGLDGETHFLEWSQEKELSPSSYVQGDVKQFQDALLSLTSARARLGHSVEALQALNETVRVAQQHGDAACLVHCLSSLCSLQMSEISRSRKNTTRQMSWAGPIHRARLVLLLRRCLARSIELRLPHLCCFSRLSLAYLDMHNPVPTSRIPLTGATHFSVINGQLMAKSQAAHALSDTITNCYIDLHRTALASSVLSRHGNPALSKASSNQSNTALSSNSGLQSRADHQQPSELYGQTLGQCENLHRIPDAVGDTTVTAHIMRATSWEMFGGSGMARSNVLTIMASLRRQTSPENLDFLNGWLAIKSAERLGDDFAEDFFSNVVTKQNGLHCRNADLVFEFRKAISCHDGFSAYCIANRIRALAETLTQNREEGCIEADRYFALALLSCDNVVKAEKIAQQACSRAYKAGLFIPTVKILLLLSEIHRFAGNHVTSLPYALSAYQQAESRGLDLLAAKAEFLVCERMTDLHSDHFYQARRTVEKLLPLFLSNADLDFQGRALLLLAKCHLTSVSPSELQSRPGIILSPLKSAIDIFYKAKVSHLHHILM